MKDRKRVILAFTLLNIVLWASATFGQTFPEEPSVRLGKGKVSHCLNQNYPNPFNPETWIPFSLSRSENVRIVIYNSAGKLVRTLDLGLKDAGDYLCTEKAAYWDGKNDGGEGIASGVYFYTIEVGKFRDSRKMVVAR